MNTISCPHCGESHPANMRFCPNTGQPIPRTSVCPRCDEPIEDTWKVCASCGQPLKTIKDEQVAKPRWWIAALFLIGLGGLVIVGYWWLVSRYGKTGSTYPQVPVSEGTPLPWPTVAISPENASQVVELTRWGKGPINGLAWSPDGTQLAIASSIGIYLYDNDLQLIKFVETDAWMRCVMFSANGMITAAGIAGKNVQVWDISSGKEILDLNTSSDGYVGDIAISPDGKNLAASVSDYNRNSSTVVLWEMESGRKLYHLVHKQLVSYLAFSPDGRILASSSTDGTVRLWNVLRGEEVGSLRDENTNPLHMAFSPDQRTLGVTYGQEVRLWDIATGKELFRTISDENNIVFANTLAFSPDGRLLVIGSWSPKASLSSLTFWDAISGRMLKTLSGLGEVTSIAFSPDGKTLASGMFPDGILELWDTTGGEKLHTLSDFSRMWGEVCYSQDGKTIGSSLRDGSVELRDSTNGRVIRKVSDDDNRISSFALSPDGRDVAIGLQDGVIEIQDLDSRQVLLNLNGHTSSVDDLEFAPDGSRLVSASSDGMSKLWDLKSGHELYTWEVTFQEVIFSPSGYYLAYKIYSHPDWMVKLWDMEGQKEMYTLAKHQGNIYDIDFSPDSTSLVTTALDKPATLWDVSTGQELLTFREDKDEIYRAAFSPDGKILAVSSYNNLQGNLIQIYDLHTGRKLDTLLKHMPRTPDLNFSPDGRVLMTWSFDGVVRLWGVAP